MKWSVAQAKAGDIIRVKSGNFYHYGIYVSDDEVIQFGLRPDCNVGLKESEIKVLSSTVQVFLNGGVLEVAQLNKAEENSRLSALATIRKARSRVGEGGYHLLYNNCEHFVNSCVFGKAFCSISDDARNKILSIPVLNVYTASLPSENNFSEIAPKERNDEIISCKNAQVKREKYYVWKLLQYALERTFGKKIEKLNFTKTSYGKWKCDGCEFSLSHSSGALAVAVSRKNVGVDIERVRDVRVSISDFILSKSETAEFDRVALEDKNDWLVKKWTQKESVFKTLELKAYSIKDISTKNTKTIKVCVSNTDYYLSVCSDCLDNLKLIENVDLTTV